MNQISKHHNQVLLSLATEIRQARNWLIKSSNTTSDDTEWKARLSTLLEAAEAAGMQSIRSALEDLQSKDPSRDRTTKERSQSYTGQVLDQLADILSTIAAPIEDRFDLWLDSVNKASDILDSTTNLSSQNATRLAKCMRTLHLACISPTRAEQIEHLIKLGNAIKQLVSHHDRQHENMQTIKNQLQNASLNLMKNLSGDIKQDLFPQLTTLCRQINSSKAEFKNSIALKPAKNDLTLPKAQIETIKRVLEFYLHRLLKIKIGPGSTQTNSDPDRTKPIYVSASSYGSVVNINIENYGIINKTIVITNSIKQDLWKLRARLLVKRLSSPITRLSIQIPALTGPIEATLVECEAGPIFIPLSVIKEILSTNRSHDPKLSTIQLKPTKNTLKRQSRYAVVVEVGKWRAILHAYTLQSPRKITPVAINLEDPAWVWTRGKISSENYPIFHPLPFMTIEKDQRCLYP